MSLEGVKRHTLACSLFFTGQARPFYCGGPGVPPGAPRCKEGYLAVGHRRYTGTGQGKHSWGTLTQRPRSPFQAPRPAVQATCVLFRADWCTLYRGGAGPAPIRDRFPRPKNVLGSRSQHPPKSRDPLGSVEKSRRSQMILGAVQEQGRTPKSHGTVECVFVLLLHRLGV